jgi:hypothetical protein
VQVQLAAGGGGGGAPALDQLPDQIGDVQIGQVQLQGTVGDPRDIQQHVHQLGHAPDLALDERGHLLHLLEIGGLAPEQPVQTIDLQLQGRQRRA